MANEAKIEQTETGAVPVGDGWFVLNAREARWHTAEGRTACCDFEGDTPFEQVGLNLNVLEPGQAMAMYHWEADQEDFLVISGEALLIIEGVERQLRAWDLVHCPPGASHVIVGAGDGPCVIFALGARDKTKGADWGSYPVEPLARRHGAGVEVETDDPQLAYQGLKRPQPTRYDPKWLPDL